jgi:hypothetical protein
VRQVTAIGLFSGGLDSILACRVIMAQDIRVIGLKFVTPFFDDQLLQCKEQYCAEIREKYGINVRVVDIGPGYVDLLKNPKYGFGRNFNPCVDCKIFMLRKAREIWTEVGASFLFSGEVLGQRPMSQRRDTLRVIEKESGCEDILVRPLCARRLRETRPEREDLVDRERLHDFCGRGRRPANGAGSRLRHHGISQSSRGLHIDRSQSGPEDWSVLSGEALFRERRITGQRYPPAVDRPPVSFAGRVTGLSSAAIKWKTKESMAWRKKMTGFLP